MIFFCHSFLSNIDVNKGDVMTTIWAQIPIFVPQPNTTATWIVTRANYPQKGLPTHTCPLTHVVGYRQHPHTYAICLLCIQRSPWRPSHHSCTTPMSRSTIMCKVILTNYQGKCGLGCRQRVSNARCMRWKRWILSTHTLKRVLSN